MPSGNVHTLSTVALAVGLPALTAANGLLSPGHSLALAGGCLAGLLISPDLDIDHGNISYRMVRQSVGCFPAALWRLFWLPYARLIPHRSWVSHTPLFGTIIRLFYMICVPAFLWWLASLVAPMPLLTMPNWPWITAALLGLMASDALHGIMDAFLK